MSIINSNMCRDLNNLDHPVALQMLKLNLRTLIKCIRTSTKDICYIYLPQEIRASICTKEHLYRELNRSITLYRESLVGEVKDLLLKLIKEYSMEPHSILQSVVELKTNTASYHYMVIYLRLKNFAILTPSGGLLDAKDINDIVHNIMDDIINYIDYEALKMARYVVNINDDKLSIKYQCQFNHQVLEVTLLNMMLLLLYIEKVLTVCKLRV